MILHFFANSTSYLLNAGITRKPNLGQGDKHIEKFTNKQKFKNFVYIKFRKSRSVIYWVFNLAVDLEFTKFSTLRN